LSDDEDPECAHYSWTAGSGLASAIVLAAAPPNIQVANMGSTLGWVYGMFKRGCDLPWLLVGILFSFAATRPKNSKSQLSLYGFLYLVLTFRKTVREFVRAMPKLIKTYRGNRFDPLDKWKQDVSLLEHSEGDYGVISVTPEKSFVPAINTPTGNDLDQPQPAVGMYILLLSSATFVRPNGPANFLYAYNQRNVITTHDGEEMLLSECCEGLRACRFSMNGLGVSRYCSLGERWELARALMIRYYSIGSYQMNADHKMTLKDWVAHYKHAHKRARASVAVDQASQSGPSHRNTLFLKGDEVLYPKEGKIKARTITSVDTTVQAVCATELDQFFTMFKRHEGHDFYLTPPCWSNMDWIFSHIKVRFAVGSGKNSSDLNQWLNDSYAMLEDSHSRAISCIVAGDDFLAMYFDGKEWWFLENDFSKFDRTEGVHALQAELEYLLVQNVPYHVISTLLQTYQTPFTYQNRKLEFKQTCPMPIQRPTGGPNTTVGNTIVNVMSVIYALSNSDPLQMDREQRSLGLLPKLQIFRTMDSCTFLKGWWIIEYWVPLPSQVIKLGKILTRPSDIYRKIPDLQAWGRAAKAMAKGLGTVPLSYPILGALLSRYLSLSDCEDDPISEEYKPKVDPITDWEITLHRPRAIQMMCERYDTTEAEIVGLEELYRTVPFPSVISHPLLPRLGKRDYG
jgi:hypothetical protein